MKLILDNNVPVGIARLRGHHQVSTSPELGWTQLRNGGLLTMAEAAAFDVMITADQNIQYQQNLSDRKIALVVLGSNIWPTVRSYAAFLVDTVDAAQPGSYAFIEMPPPNARPG